MKRAYLGFLIIFIAACTAIGSVQPQDFADKLTSGYATTSALRDTAVNLLNAQKISSAEFQEVNAQLGTVRAALDVTRVQAVQDPTAASTKLDTIRAGLGALNSYLLTREQGK